MTAFDYDLFVIGGGSGGVRAARMAAATGARVALAEEYRFGGTCVIRGCVPKKLFSYAAHVREDLAHAAGYGWRVDTPGFDWPTLLANKDAEIDRLEKVYEQTVLGGAGVSCFRARAELVGPQRVALTGADQSRREVSAERILIATGGHPTKPDIPGAERAMTSNELFHLPQLPQRAVVYGGGYIAVEFAGILNGLGVETHLVYRGREVLRGFDAEVRSFLTAAIQAKGIHFHSGQEITAVDAAGVTLEDGSRIAADGVLFATGRAPNSTGLGLDALGIARDARGAIVVDDYFRTSQPSVFALGDVINRLQLTPVALAEAMVFVDNEFKGLNRVMDYHDITTAVFSNPEVATVGLTEAQAREQCGAIDVYVSTFRPMKLVLPQANERTLMKLIVEQASGRVVGAHMVGLDAAEIMQGVGIAVRMGATKADFDRTIGIHPTSAEEWVTMRSKTRS